MTRWWKCDLQVATPAWDFHYPQGSNYRVKDADAAVRTNERMRFLDDYMLALRANGIEVIALADHNTGEWIDDAKAAGVRHGVVVFPGCEITTHTGADGAHLVVIGDRDKTSQDFDRLVHGCFGFGPPNAPFRTEGTQVKPNASDRTAGQILDALPEGYLAIAPHVLSENGLVSERTARGDIRWKALHHERLVAVDPGDCANPEGGSFNARFRRREFDNFPRLPSLAFVATSDAYSMADLGKRFTWIRMAEPTIEALRQACLDHESRILCDWSPKLESFPDRNPNNVRHAWISSVSLGGNLTNSTTPLELVFHPGLNVIVGGRGSGKSSVVAALRQLYSSSDSLPSRLKTDAEDFANTVFGQAQLDARHKVQESQTEQSVRWTLQTGSITTAEGQSVPTTFSATVISQKELFERAAGDKNDPELTSRSLLTLVDNGIGAGVGYGQSFGAAYGGAAMATSNFATLLEDARAKWTTDHRAFIRLKGDLEQLPSLHSRATTLEQQVQAFAAAEVKERLARIEAKQQESALLQSHRQELDTALTEVKHAASHLAEHLISLENRSSTPEFGNVADLFNSIQASLVHSLLQATTSAAKSLEKFDSDVLATDWHAQAQAADADLEDYKANLSKQGLSPDEFSRLQEELVRTREAIKNLEDKAAKVDDARVQSTASWQALYQLFDRRRAARSELLAQIQERSGRLRFATTLMQDAAPWIDFLRTTAGLRADGYLEDVKNLATWLWHDELAGLDGRIADWHNFLTSKDAKEFQRVCGVRLQLLERLTNVEESARYRLATQLPDDVVGMEFLKEGGRPERNEDWQSVVRGSPGQRTAAMLAFVLHHGREPLVLDQPEDDLDSEWISKLVVKELRQSRRHRQLIVVSHNANIPVLGDAEQVIALENRNGALCVRTSEEAVPGGAPRVVQHVGPVEAPQVRRDIQSIMEGGVAAFVLREQKYNNETRSHKAI